jgi:hypothetical protein
MSIRDWLERIFLAITFAEAGDEKTARKFLEKKKARKESKHKSKRPRLRPRR